MKSSPRIFHENFLENTKERPRKECAKIHEKAPKMKIIKENTELTESEMEAIHIASEDWENILDGALAMWGKDILNLENWKE